MWWVSQNVHPSEANSWHSGTDTETREGKCTQGAATTLELKHIFWPWIFQKILFLIKISSVSFNLHINPLPPLLGSALCWQEENDNPDNFTSSLVTLDYCSLKLLTYSNPPGFVVFFVWGCLSPAFQTSVIYLSLCLRSHPFSKISVGQKLFLTLESAECSKGA